MYSERLRVPRPAGNPGRSIRPAPSPTPSPSLRSGTPSGGRPLDGQTQTEMGARFGHDFSRVRVHTDVRAGEWAQLLGANAYTIGADIVFGPGRYAPGTAAGERLLAHELTHVVQQARSGPGDPGRISQRSDASEREADALAGRAAAGETVHVRSAPGAAIAREPNDTWRQLFLPGMDGPPVPAPAAGYPPFEPDVTLPIEYPNAGVGPNDVGYSTRHRLQTPRGPGQVSEHVIPGGQWEAISTPPGGDPIYESQTGRHYKNDSTVRVEADVADYKTNRGPRPDNGPGGRTQAIKNQIANNQGVNVIEDLYRPSIEQTVAARNAVPGSQLTPGQITHGATEQLGHQFDIGAGDVSYRQSPVLRDRSAELRATGRAVASGDPHGIAAFEQYDWDGTFGQPTAPGSQRALPGMEDMALPPRSAAVPAEQMWLPGMDPAHAPLPGQLDLPFDAPHTPAPSGPGTSSAGGGAMAAEDAAQAAAKGGRSLWGTAGKLLNGANWLLNPLGIYSSATSFGENLRRGNYLDATMDAAGVTSSVIGTAGMTGLLNPASVLNPIGAGAGALAGGYALGSYAVNKSDAYARENNLFGEGDDGNQRSGSEWAADTGRAVDSAIDDFDIGGCQLIGQDYIGDVVGGATSILSSWGAAAYSGLHAAGDALFGGPSMMEMMQTYMELEENKKLSDAVVEENMRELSRAQMEQDLAGPVRSVAYETVPPDPKAQR